METDKIRVIIREGLRKMLDILKKTEAIKNPKAVEQDINIAPEIPVNKE
jgi:hypothetical protein